MRPVTPSTRKGGIVLAVLALALVAGGCKCPEGQVPRKKTTTETRCEWQYDSLGRKEWKCYTVIRTEWECVPRDRAGGGPLTSSGAWNLPGAADFLQHIAWQVLDRTFEVVPEDLQVRLRGDVPGDRLEDAVLTWELLDDLAEEPVTGTLPLRLLESSGDVHVLVPEAGPEFAAATEALATLLADRPGAVRPLAWTIEVPAVDAAGAVPAVAEARLSLFGWSP